MTPRRFALTLMFLLSLAILPFATVAQDAPVADRTATGGATTLQDILERQKGLTVDNTYRSDNIGDPAIAAPISDQLGTMGGLSQSDDWRALRYNKAEVNVSSRSPAASVLMQDGGMTWLAFREGPLSTYGGWLLLGMLGVLALFYFIRGKIRIDGALTGRKILRFAAVERLLGGHVRRGAEGR